MTSLIVISLPMKRLLSFLLLHLTLCTSCKKGETPCRKIGAHEFIVPVEYQPAVDTLHVGDTLVVESKFSSKMYDRATKAHYILKDVDFAAFLVIMDIADSANSQGIYDFTILVDSTFSPRLTEYSSGGVRFNFEYLFNNNEYSFKTKFICQKPGFYYVAFSSSLEVRGSDESFDDQCRNKKWIPVFEWTNRRAGNENLLLASNDTLVNRWLTRPATYIHENAGFAFYVEE